MSSTPPFRSAVVPAVVPGPRFLSTAATVPGELLPVVAGVDRARSAAGTDG